MRTATLLLFAVSAVSSTVAQTNTIAGLDARVARVDDLSALGRTGTYPTGRNGLSMDVELCNVGTVPVQWLRAMNPDHPILTFMVCREHNGRFEQISDRGFVKHAVSAMNGNGCGTCTTQVRTMLGPGCSDIYSVPINGNRMQLAPASEVDPWLGAWNPLGSHFDRGEPNVGPPQNMDGERSLTQVQVNAMGPVTHRVEVNDADLDLAGAQYYYACQVVVAGEAESLRGDTVRSRPVTPAWGGTAWDFSNAGPGVSGSVLQHWSKSTLASSVNGADDGRLYVAVAVTGPDSTGLWHYEYAVHNRDNSRGAAALRIPICGAARVLNAAFRDVDADPTNDWAVSVTGTEVAFLAAAGNALEWNAIYNFAFDADAAPVAGAVTLDQARTGPGSTTVVVSSQLPGHVPTEFLGDGCGAPPPVLSPAGTPPFAAIPNLSFGLRITGAQPGGLAAVLLSATGGAVPLGGGCILYAGLPIGAIVGPFAANPAGEVTVPLPIPNVAAFEGAALFVQGLDVVAGGPALGLATLTNGLRVRIGNQLVPCP